MSNVKELNVNNQTYDIVGKAVVDQNNATPLKQWSGTKAQYDAIVSKDAHTIYNITDDTNPTQALLESIYPVGSIYIGTMNTCPLAALFGTWEKVSSGRVLQGADENHNPGTAIEAGLPNITGSMCVAIPNAYQTYLSGAFSEDNENKHADGGHNGNYGGIKFDASSSNSIYGNSDTVQPQAFVVNIWERTA